jgi:hypothetical protein
MFRNFFPINAMLRTDTTRRDGYPLGERGTYLFSTGSAGSGPVPPTRPGPKAAEPVENRYVPLLAGPADDPDIRRLLADAVFPGDVRVSLERAPSPLAAAAIDGDVHQLIVARDRSTLALAGMAARSVRDVYVNGAVMRVGYLGQLRVNRSVRRLRSLIDGGFDFCRQLHQAGDAPFYLTSLVADNAAARRLLVDRRSRSAPRFLPLHTLRTFAIATARTPRVSTPAGVRLEPGTDALLDDIAACLDRNGSRYQFAPRWTAGDLRSDRTRGLAPEDFVIARRGARVVGCLALWDQRAFKQVVIRGYSPRLARWRPLINGAGPWLGGVPLPPAGAPLPFAYLSHAAVDDDRAEVFAALATAQCRRARAAGLGHVVAAFVRAHPFHDAIARGFRHRAYDSVLYGAAWADGEAHLAALDRRIPQPEVAVL